VVGRTELGVVRQYIENQEENHRQQTFQDEFVELLHAHGVEYKPQYVWE
jgi:hypothetical protein